MELLRYKATSQYPEIILDKTKGVFEFSGNSLPEDAKTFYQPILQWWDAYTADPNHETIVKFKMVYYNTPSSKLIFQILKKIENLANLRHKVKIIWMYNDEDIDIREAGFDLAEHIKVPFEFQIYKE
jgi:hypothetical protein